MSPKDPGFDGTWRVDVGLRQGATLEIREEAGRYTVTDSSDTLLYTLELDDVAFTLRGETPACLSLWQNAQYLFGIEYVDDAERPLRVWGAVRVSGGPMERLVDPDRPGWRVSQPWIVRDTSGPGLPAEEGDTLQIELEGDEFQIFKKPEAEPFDRLQESDLNRTLDGATRSVALWREGPRGQSYLFSMVVTPQEVFDAIRERGVGGDIEAVKKILAERMRNLLPFEIDLLAEQIVKRFSSVAVWGKRFSSVAVWGADEG